MRMITSLTTLFLLTLITFIREGGAVGLTINTESTTVRVFNGNERIELNCTADTTAVEIQWSYNGSSIPSNYSTTVTIRATFTTKTSTLTLNSPTPDQSGVYACFVPFTLDTMVSTSLTILAPIYLLNSNPKVVAATVGDTVTLHISSLGLGQHTYEWTRRRRSKQIKSDAIGVNTRQLILPNVGIEDEGRYIFTATSQWSTNDTKVDLTVTYPPADIIEHPQNHTSFVSLAATLYCNATSPYPITYSWRRVNSSLNITDQAIGYNSSTLMIVRTEHSDEGWYQCVTSVFGVESFSQPAYLTVKELPALQNLMVEMNLEQNEVFLNWKKLDEEILSSDVMISYKLFYSARGACAVSECQDEMCRVQKKIKSKLNRVTFTQELLPFTNYTWLLELTYSIDGSTVQSYNARVDAITGQSNASVPVNLTVLHESFQWVNLTWDTPQCPNGIINYYRVYYNESYKDVQSGMDYYILTGLKANSVYNISVAAITGEDNDIIGDYASVISTTPVGPPLVEPQDNRMSILVESDVTTGTMRVNVPSVKDDQGEISFVYILVSTDGLLKPDKSTVSLDYQEAAHSGLVYYVAAALSYNEYNDSNTFTLGNGKKTTGLNGQAFTNVKLSIDTNYYYFIRAYSLQYTEQNGLVSTSSLYEIGNFSSVTTMPTDDDDNDDGDDFSVTIAIAVLAGLIVIIMVLICIIVVCCCCIISKTNRNRKYVMNGLAWATKKQDVEDGVDSEPSDKTNNTSAAKAVSNDYTELLESITDANAQQCTKPHQNHESVDERVSSGSSCSVSSGYVNAIDPALGISEGKKKASNGKAQETDLPSQEVVQYSKMSETPSPKKESKHSWFSFRSKSKSKNETKSKSPQADHGNPTFDQKQDNNEETQYANVVKSEVKEVVDNTEEESGYTDVIKDASQDTTETAGYLELANTTVDIEQAPAYYNVKQAPPTYSNVTAELSHATTTNNSNEENA